MFSPHQPAKGSFTLHGNENYIYIEVLTSLKVKKILDAMFILRIKLIKFRKSYKATRDRVAMAGCHTE